MKPHVTTLLALCFVTPSFAQEVRLTDGRVFVGPIKTTDEGIQVTTRDGVVRVAAADIERTRSRDELIRELDRVAEQFGDAAHAEIELASLARRVGLEQRMWRHLEATLRRDDLSDTNLRRLDRLLASLDRELLPSAKLQSRPAVRVRALLGKVGSERDAKAHAVEAILATMPDAAPDLRKQARTNGSAMRRATALRALARRSKQADHRFSLRAAIVDPNARVRRVAMQTEAAQRDPQEAVAYLSPGLLANSVPMRVRTAEAFANLGDPAAIPVLVNAGLAAVRGSVPGSGTSNGYIAVIRQQAYVRDFDVEVAQAAFIADPKIDVVQEGVVLDASVFSVTTHRIQLVKAYRRALTALGGSDPGADVDDWPGWASQIESNPQVTRRP